MEELGLLFTCMLLECLQKDDVTSNYMCAYMSAI